MKHKHKGSKKKDRKAKQDEQLKFEGNGQAIEEGVETPPMETPPSETVPAEKAELSNKAYAKELKKLHVELVKLQEWVKHKGLKVCVVFEGRDGAGKGGTIKAITERVSPRVFRVMALSAPTEREKSQMYIQRYIQHFPGGRRSRHLRPQLVQPRRRRTGHGILHRGTNQTLPRSRPLPSKRR
jgi:polyphosphate kinase 2 (PPK2 family)